MDGWIDMRYDFMAFQYSIQNSAALSPIGDCNWPSSGLHSLGKGQKPFPSHFVIFISLFISIVHLPHPHHFHILFAALPFLCAFAPRAFVGGGLAFPIHQHIFSLALGPMSTKTFFPLTYFVII
jgi:hypothetical protein